MATGHRIQPDKLKTFVNQLCETAGTPPDIAEVVSRTLVNADLKGQTSHGALRMPSYLDGIEGKGLIPDAKPEILRQTPSTAAVDAHYGWGHYSAQWSMELAMEKAKTTAMGAVSLARNHHKGRLGEYVERAADAGFIGIVMLGWGGKDTGSGTPYGASARALAPNPIAIGVPSADDKPFIADFATTMVADGKMIVARMNDTKLPPGCVLDKHGQPSIEPE